MVRGAKSVGFQVDALAARLGAALGAEAIAQSGRDPRRGALGLRFLRGIIGLLEARIVGKPLRPSSPHR